MGAVPRSSRLAIIAVLLAVGLTAGAPAAQAKLTAPAKRFLADQAQLQRQFGADEEQRMLASIAATRKELGSCSVLKRLPRDRYQRTITYLYVLLDLIQEMTAPYAPQLAAAAGTYRTVTYGDRVLDRAARVRYAHLRSLSTLKPFRTCAVLNDWRDAGWPTEWKPSGETGIAVAAIYDQDVQIPDESALLRRLRKLGASPFQRSRTRSFAISERVLDGLDAALARLLPAVDYVDWR